MRTAAIWILGLVGSFFLGGLFGGGMYPPDRMFLYPFRGGVVWGSFAGVCLFISLRLWFGGERK
jgi:hypothetical protein